jgi:hypothetical protein
MSRWTYDEDRLPEGFSLTGYDADEQLYYFSDQNGCTWYSPTRHGDGMTRVSNNSSRATHEEDGEVDIASNNATPDGYQRIPNPFPDTAGGDNNGFRQLYPFFLLIGVVLLLCGKFILFPGMHHSEPQCPSSSSSYMLQPGDTCWEISHQHGIPLEQLEAVNPDKDCAVLMPGSTICIPGVVSPTTQF